MEQGYSYPLSFPATTFFINRINPIPLNPMSYLSRRSYLTPPSNLSDLLLRDVASLLLTSELISSSLVALRPECESVEEITVALDAMIALCDEGESRIQQPLLDAGIVLPTTTDTSASTLITGFFTRLPSGDDPRFAEEVIINLQLLAQHVELKSRLAGEEAMLVGLDGLSQALADWSGEWRTCGHKIGGTSFRKKSRIAYVDNDSWAFAIPAAI